MTKTWRSGGCHCASVRFRVRRTSSSHTRQTVLECNCLMCVKKGNLHLLVGTDDLEITAGSDHLSTYRFGARTAEHYFCKTCGIHSFYRPDPTQWSINVRCLDDFGSSKEEVSFTIEPLDNKSIEAAVMKALKAEFPKTSLERRYIDLCEDGIYNVPDQTKRLGITSRALRGVVLRIQRALSALPMI